MCTCDVDGHAEFYRHEERKARRSHHCYECGETIKPGDRYHAFACKWEGSIESWDECATCRIWAIALIDAQERECGCSGYNAGELWRSVQEFAEEHLGAPMPVRVRRVAPRVSDPMWSGA